MEKERGGKILAIVALVLAVAGLSVGFAAYSSVLNITSTANVQVDGSNWSVGFSSDGTNMAPLTTGTAPTINGVTASDNNGSAKLMKYTFYQNEAPTLAPDDGSKVEYSFYVLNDGDIDATLDSISFGTLTCTYVASGTDRLLEEDASNPGAYATPNSSASTISECADMFDVSLTFGTGQSAVTYGPSDSSYNVDLDAGDNIPVVLTIEATGDNPNVLDGDFTVSLGNTTVNFKSA